MVNDSFHVMAVISIMTAIFVWGINTGLVSKFNWKLRRKKIEKAVLLKEEDSIDKMNLCKSLLLSNEFIVLTKKNDSWFLSRHCKDSDFKAYCPNIYDYLKPAEDGVEWVNNLVNDLNKQDKNFNKK